MAKYQWRNFFFFFNQTILIVLWGEKKQIMPVCEEDRYREWLRFLIVFLMFQRISLFTPVVQGLCSTSLLACFVSPSPEEHTRTHARVHTLSFSPSLSWFLPFHGALTIQCCFFFLLFFAVAVAIAHGYLRATHCCIPKSGCVLLTLRCGSVLRVYTGGKGVNATCFKEVQDVFTSALTGTLGKSWN